MGSQSIDYDHQPYYPNAVPFPLSGGPYLVYLDVWQREVTFLEDPDLVEKAVGVDTTGRLQTVWQVKWLGVGAGATCSAPGQAWNNLLLSPGAQLTTGVVQSTASGPCCLTPNTGYTGLENQLYRVEIHQKGTLSSATFKWSRDNASVATGVTGIAQGGTALTVQSTGKDNVLGFNVNDWVEITDDWLELNGLAGDLHQVTQVNAAAKTITLASPVSSSNFPVNSNGLTMPYRHTRLTRWDGTGTTGDTPVSSSAVTLENGITVSFGLAAGGEQGFNTGDYWVFAARSVDGTVEYLDAAPPRGIHHHYAQLSVVNFASVALPASGAVTLSDLSQPPVGFLQFQPQPPGSVARVFWHFDPCQSGQRSQFRPGGGPQSNHERRRPRLRRCGVFLQLVLYNWPQLRAYPDQWRFKVYHPEPAEESSHRDSGFSFRLFGLQERFAQFGNSDAGAIDG